MLLINLLYFIVLKNIEKYEKYKINIFLYNK